MIRAMRLAWVIRLLEWAVASAPEPDRSDLMRCIKPFVMRLHGEFERESAKWKAREKVG